MDRILLELLPPVQRMALAYAPARARLAWLALLALDVRLGRLLRSQREPLLTQIRLAWWRDRLAGDAADWPRGEPLLAALSSWHGHHRRLVALVDGWEMLLGDAPLASAALAGFVAGRAAAMQGLALVLECPDVADAAHRAGAVWAIADLTAHLSRADESAAARMLAAGYDRQLPRLPRALRPLTILHGLAARSLQDDGAGQGDRSFWLALRLGIFGV